MITFILSPLSLSAGHKIKFVSSSFVICAIHSSVSIILPHKMSTPPQTPLQYSAPLSSLLSHPVYLKLENTHPLNSFKIRGLAHVCKKRLSSASTPCTAFTTFSGGNAGTTLAYVAQDLKIPCHIFVPSFVSPRILARMRSYGAIVKVVETSQEAESAAKKLAEEDESIQLVHPYNDPELWEGYSSIIEEIREQLPSGSDVPPACIILSVGGGGMLMGLMTGIKRIGWPPKSLPLIATETHGAHSFNKSIAAGHIVQNVMTSIAKTLGAPSVAPAVMDWLPSFNVISQVQSDKSAVAACIRFADDHAYCVEPACGVSLSLIYDGILRDILAQNNTPLIPGGPPVVVIVCGGQDSSVSILTDYATSLGVQVL